MGITSYQTQHHKANHVLRVSEFRSGELSDPLSLGLATRQAKLVWRSL
jgi:hypothetical protein